MIENLKKNSLRFNKNVKSSKNVKKLQNRNHILELVDD